MSEKCFKCGNGNCNLTVVRFHEKPEWICRECMDNALAFDTPENRALVERIKGGEGDVLTKYNELLYAVGRKFTGESRHDTALRYIREKERFGEWDTGACKSNGVASDPAAAQKWNGEAKGLEETQGTDGTKVTGGQHG